MTVLLFVVMLVVLIVGHELGHFIVAKLSGMRVPEFGLGFPPKLWGKKIGNTEYTLNALPFGGFVKIVGEELSDNATLDPSAFSNRPKFLQAATLFAGPFANIALAFVLSVAAFMIGIPAASDSGYDVAYIHGVRLAVVDVIPGSPAARSGVLVGDSIVSVAEHGETRAVADPDAFAAAVSAARGPFVLSLERGGKPVSVSLTPAKGVVSDDPERSAVGLATAAVGTLRLPFLSAAAAGFFETAQNAEAVVSGVASLVVRAFTFSANLSGVAGPVGIAGLVDDAARFGLGSILSFAALISVNLGVINLFPFPALDGGRLAFIAAEAATGRRIPARVANALNAAGFAALILLLAVVTAHDVSRLIG